MKRAANNWPIDLYLNEINKVLEKFIPNYTSNLMVKETEKEITLLKGVIFQGPFKEINKIEEKINKLSKEIKE